MGPHNPASAPAPERALGIVFTDVDGTLLDSDHRAIPASARPIAALAERDIPFVLVSARPPEGLRTIQRALGFTGPLVCFSGAYAIDADGTVLLSRVLPIDTALAIKGFIARELPDLCCMTYGFEKWIVDSRADPRVRREERAVEFESAEGDVAAEFADTGVHKFLVVGEPAQIEEAEAHVRAAFPALAVARSSPILLEIMSGAASKAEGVRTVCAHTGVPLARAVAFGDGRNDIDMLRAVPVSYAMANAPEEVKRAAARVCAYTNDECGVSRTVEELQISGL